MYPEKKMYPDNDSVAKASIGPRLESVGKGPYTMVGTWKK